MHAARLALAGAAFALILGLALATGGEPRPRKYALLIGINKYEHGELDPLQYAEHDVQAMADLLKERGGYQCTLLTGAQATRVRIVAELKRLEQQGNADGIALVALAGHGMQPEGSSDAYFVPWDAAKQVVRVNGKDVAEWNLGAMVNLSTILAHLSASKAGSRALLVDACRNDPKTGRGRGFATNLKLSDLGERTAVLLSCSQNQKSYEDKKFGGGHGAFFHQVLEGLSREADDYTALDLAAHVKREVPKRVREVADAKQTPFPLIQGDVDFQLQPVRVIVPPPGTAITNTIGMKLAYIPAGTFTMGSPKEEAGRFENEGLQHEVTLTKGYYLGKYEVTRGEFRKFVDATGYQTEGEKDGEGEFGYDEKTKQFAQKPEYTWCSAGFAQTDAHPVVNVSWNDAQAFCKWLSGKEGKRYSLPTEAQWEYAARAGTKTRYHTGNGDASVEGYGDVGDVSCKKVLDFGDFAFDDGYVFTAPVGTFKANAFGLHDMIGNACEWCEDGYDGKAYGRGDCKDPLVVEGAYRVIRGGGWLSNAVDCRSAYRNGYAPADRSGALGFRVALQSVR